MPFGFNPFTGNLDYYKKNTDHHGGYYLIEENKVVVIEVNNNKLRNIAFIFFMIGLLIVGYFYVSRWLLNQKEGY